MSRLYGFLGVVIVGFSLTSIAQAATLYFDPSLATLDRGDTEIISVRLDTNELADECINAVEGVIDFVGPIQAVDISLGGSIFSLWVEEPTISSDGRSLTFAGGVPNGYCGRIAGDPRLTNTLFDIVVRADAVAPADNAVVEAAVEFIGPTFVYLNDGFGTTNTPQVTPSLVTVLPELSTATTNPWRDAVEADQIDPQEFSIVLAQDHLIANGRYYITFNTVDKQTGIDRYEVIEEPLAQFGSFTWGRANAPWIKTRSPYVLKDQTLNSVIRVKAIDKAGNEYIATFIPDEELRTIPLTRIIVWVVLGLTVLFVFSFVLMSLSGRRARRRLESLEQEYGYSDPTQETESEAEQSNKSQYETH